MSLSLEDIQAAQRRLKGRIRRTPLLSASQMRAPLAAGQLHLKLESLQVSGSFKARGATNALLSLSHEELRTGICCASGGNHGLAVAFAGWTAGTRAVVFLPESTPDKKAQEIASWGAEVRVEGQVFDDANQAAQAFCAAEGLTYLHPFDDSRIMAGQGTVGLEILEELSSLDILVVAIGGGGLISGIGRAVKALRPEVRIIGVEPQGAPTLKRSLEAGELVTLESIKTVAGTLAPRRSAEANFEIIRETVEEIVLVSDEEMREAARWLWREFGLGAELAGAAAIAALQTGAVTLEEGQSGCALICGRGTDGVT